MVTPTNGTITLVGLRSGRQYGLSVYSSDVIGAFVTYSLNGVAVAGSQNFYIIPEDCVLADMSLTTGQTVATAWVPQVNDVNVGSVIPFANILNTLQTRAFPRLQISAGRKLTLVQA